MILEELRDTILERRLATPRETALLVGISGIDASGKGFIASQLATGLEAGGFRTALINVDGWLNLPHVRFSDTDRAEHFYYHALRLDEMFERLIMPLKETRSVDLTMELAEETAAAFRPHTYSFADIDIILLEGIFIFKHEFVRHFDLKIWVDCSFESALQRAIARSQEGLPPEATVAAYETIYFPAQRVHFNLDRPREYADALHSNE